ncbi:uncharacterized protein LOC112681227 [Sipha flava]|jgi:hypothetical protein|uniref:Uncharacterized protein LOC112681227 n=1 Tax=Sipha flava TaxID=143950 RepID=A0A8B8F930_9HEMI|nr:uncharacterized protein LOC112681227 [Sipha flava]
MSCQTLSLSGNTTELECRFFPPIEVGDSAEIGLLGLQTYNSMPNVEPGCDTLGIIDARGDTSLIQIPTGCYEISTLEAKIVEHLASSSVDFFELKSDPSTLKCTIRCSNDVVFNVNNSMAPLLGFNKTTRLPANIKHESSDLVNIMRINCIKVVCNLALGSFENGKQSHTIHEFYPAVAPGFKIIEVPKYCVLYRLGTNTVDNVRVTLRDQDDKLINIRGETLNVRLLVKKKI